MRVSNLNRQKSEKGQAVLEYVLMVLLATTCVSILASTFHASITGMWGYYTKKIVAACPTGCPADPKYRFR